jgi:CMP-N-acetylneuraminic acid synthetase
MSVMAIIPARIGSNGIPHKNFVGLAGLSPLQRAYAVAGECECEPIVISTDANVSDYDRGRPGTIWLQANAPLHTDECAMIDVIRDVLARVPGPNDQIIVLLQPTQPLREPKHVQAAVALLRSALAQSVVSVIALPTTHNPEWQYTVRDDRLRPFPGSLAHEGAARRQDLTQTYIRDGTIYCFWRRTVTWSGNIYGWDVRPLIIDPSETCPLDTPADWVDAERRLREREG